jgi:hypothetical protein
MRDTIIPRRSGLGLQVKRQPLDACARKEYISDVETVERQLPGDPVAFVRTCVRERRILWTYHVNMRLKARFVTRQAILDSVDSYELVESYPDDKYLPSYLVLARPAGGTIHVLFAADFVGDNVRVVTAYRPSPDEWTDELKTRRV